MDQLDVILSIVASVFSIAATVISLLNRSEVKKLRDLYQDNRLVAKGDGNTQVIGSGNKVSGHGKH